MSVKQPMRAQLADRMLYTQHHKYSKKEYIKNASRVYNKRSMCVCIIHSHTKRGYSKDVYRAHLLLLYSEIAGTTSMQGRMGPRKPLLLIHKLFLLRMNASQPKNDCLLWVFANTDMPMAKFAVSNFSRLPGLYKLFVYLNIPSSTCVYILSTTGVGELCCYPP